MLLVLNRLIIHNFPFLPVVFQLKFEGVIGFIVIAPFAPATVGFNISLVVPLAIGFPEVGFTIFGPRVTVS